MLAPGGFALGYIAARAAGNLAVGCPVQGPCGHPAPLLAALSLAIVVMGSGCTAASLRLRYWWETVLVWGAGILAVLLLVSLVGWMGLGSPQAAALGVAWIAAALAVVTRIWRHERR